MIDGKYDVVFRGQIIKSLDISAVQANLVKLFNSSPDAVTRLFSGNEVTIRKSLNYADAMKYQSALKAAGALALIKEVEPEKDTQNMPLAATETLAPQDSNKGSPDPANTPENDNLSIAEVGAQLLPTKVYEKKEVDTSALSLAKAGERLLPKKEPKIYPQPSIDHLSLDDK